MEEKPASQVFPPHGRCLFSVDSRAPYRFCGARTVGPERAWCQDHRAVVYQNVMPAPIRPAREANVVRRGIDRRCLRTT